MQRKNITKEELVLLLNKNLQQIEGCEHCKFSGITTLREYDENGCNWSPESLFCKIGEAPEEYVRPHINKIVAEAYKIFNVST